MCDTRNKIKKQMLKLRGRGRICNTYDRYRIKIYNRKFLLIEQKQKQKQKHLNGQTEQIQIEKQKSKSKLIDKHIKRCSASLLV